MRRRRGDVERSVRDMLQSAADAGAGALTFALIRDATIQEHGGDPNRDRLPPATVRSLQRVLKALVDRGDVLIAGGRGGQKDPFRYALAERCSCERAGKQAHCEKTPRGDGGANSEA